MNDYSHDALWRRAVDESRYPEDDGAQLAFAFVDKAAEDDGLAVADTSGAIREVDCVCPYGNDVCDCPQVLAVTR